MMFGHYLRFTLVLLSLVFSTLAHASVNKMVYESKYCPPAMFVPTTHTSRLNIVVIASYPNANVSIDDDLIPKKTTDAGYLKYTIPSRQNGCHILKVYNKHESKSHRFYLKEDGWLTCRGIKNFYCVLTQNRIKAAPFNRVRCKWRGQELAL